MRALLVLVIVLSSVGADAANDDAQATLSRALEHMEATRFAQAVPLLRAVLYPPSLPPKQLRQARGALAQALFYLQQFDGARLELRYLLKQQPNAKLDATETAPDFMAFFESVRDELGKRRPTKTDATRADTRPVQPTSAPVDTPTSSAPTSATPTSTPQPSPSVAPASAPTSPVSPPVSPQSSVSAPARVRPAAPSPWYVNMLPLGIGQFANRSYVVGGIFLALEAGFLTTNIYFTIATNRLVKKDGGFALGQQSRIYYIVQDASAAALYGTLLFGLLDGLLWAPKRAAAQTAQVSVTPLAQGGATFNVFGDL